MRKNISQPDVYWHWFEKAAKRQGLPLSVWIGQQCVKGLPPKIRAQLADRPDGRKSTHDNDHTHSSDSTHTARKANRTHTAKAAKRPETIHTEPEHEDKESTTGQPTAKEAAFLEDFQHRCAEQMPVEQDEYEAFLELDARYRLPPKLREYARYLRSRV